MADTNVPEVQFTLSGVVLPAEADILTGVLADLNTALGGNMSQSLSSPQGQMSQSFTAIIGDKNDEVLEIANQVDPDTSSGRWQDAIGRIYFLQRIPASGTLVAGTCTGLAGTVIPSGSIAQDTAGFKYSSLGDVTIPMAGNVVVQFQCLVDGAIGCPINTLTTIFKAVTGWESVTNLTAGVPGTSVESRADFEFRRKNSVASNAVNSIQAVFANVLAVDDVLDAYVTDNSTNATVNKGSTNFPVIANSIYVAVAGGANADIAVAIWNKKSLGCQYNGTTTYTLTDESQGVLPYPTYVIKWVRPAALPIFFAVNIANNAQLPSNITSLTQAAIIAAFNGADGGTRARIASNIYAGRFYAGVSGIDPNVEVLSILLGVAASPTGTSVLVGIDQLPTIDATQIVVHLI